MSANIHSVGKLQSGQTSKDEEAIEGISDGHRIGDYEESSDDRDPLNWSLSRKFAVFGTLCLSAFAGVGSAIAHANGLVAQAEAYDTTPEALSYSISAATAGLMTGPYFILPLARVVGSSAIMFWSLIGAVSCSVWSACMTSHKEYLSFVLSRLVGGFFSSIAPIIGNEIIVNIFPVHQRGRAFALYTSSFGLGVVAGPTFDGFIVQHASWTIEFWYWVALQSLVLLLVFVLFEETGYDRVTHKPRSKISQAESWISNRLRTFFTCQSVDERPSLSNLLKCYTAPILIFVSPVTILIGLCVMINFGWVVMVNALLGIWLQEPAPQGYGFSPQEAAAFCLTLWAAIFCCQAYTFLLNDRVPMWLAKRHGNVWATEYRLQTLWPLCALTMPLGLALFGAALQYHLSVAILAIGLFLICFSANGSIPMTTNYLVESFVAHPQEAGTAINVWRLVLGLCVPFFFSKWAKEVSVGWVFGTCACLNIFASLCVFALLWQGPRLRIWNLID